MIFIFEIYDLRSKKWYVDYITKDEKIAEEYFDILMKFFKNDKSVVKVITRLDV